MSAFSGNDDVAAIAAAEGRFGCWWPRLLALLVPLTVWAVSWGVARGQAEATPTAGSQRVAAKDTGTGATVAGHSVRDIPLVVVEGSSYIGPADSPGHARLPLSGLLCTLPKASRPAAQSLPPSTMPGGAEWTTFSPYHASRPTLEAIGAGKLVPQPPAAGEPLYLILTAPFLNIRKNWLPTNLTLADKTLTLSVTALLGSEKFGAGKNFSCRRVQLIALPALPAGDYKLALEVRRLSESSSFPGLYSGSFEDRAVTAFTLPTTGEATATTAIAEADLSRHAAPALSHRVYQDLLHFARFADPQTPAGPRLDVGKLDAYPAIPRSSTRRPMPIATQKSPRPPRPTLRPAGSGGSGPWSPVRISTRASG